MPAGPNPTSVANSGPRALGLRLGRFFCWPVDSWPISTGSTTVGRRRCYLSRAGQDRKAANKAIASRGQTVFAAMPAVSAVDNPTVQIGVAIYG